MKMMIIDNDKYGAPKDAVIAVIESRIDLKAILGLGLISDQDVEEAIDPQLLTATVSLVKEGANMDAVEKILGIRVTHIIFVWDFEYTKYRYWDSIVAHEVGHILHGYGDYNLINPYAYLHYELAADRHAIELGFGFIDGLETFLNQALSGLKHEDIAVLKDIVKERLEQIYKYRTKRKGAE